jgi:hypothetical membrane protein
MDGMKEEGAMAEGRDVARRAWMPATTALLLCVAAAVGFGMASPEFSHLRHPLALLGARAEPHALAFNLLGFVLPGLLLAWAALRARRAMGAAGWGGRIGTQLVLLSALAFAAQGLLPLDPYDLNAPASRLHALAWTCWWVAFVPGALLLASSLRGGRAVGIALALLVPGFALFAADAMPAALAQRVAVVLWFAWWLALGAALPRKALSRGAASG